MAPSGSGAGSGRGAARRAPSIRRIVAITMIGPVVALTVLLVLLAAYTGRRGAERAAEGRLENLTLRVAAQVGLFLGQAERLSNYTAALLADGVFPTEDAAAQQSFVEQLRAFPAVSVAILAAADGSARGAIRDPDGIVLVEIREGEAIERSVDAGGRIVVDPPRRRYALDPRTRPWFIVARELDEAALRDPSAPRAAWTEPYAFVRRGVEGFDLGVSFVRVVSRRDGEFVGVLSVDVTFDALGRFLRDEAEEGVVLQVADPLQLVATSRGAAVESDGSQRWLDPALRGALGPEISFEGGPSFVRATIDGTRFRAAVAPLRLDARREWVVVAALPESRIFAESDRSALWMAALSAVALASAIGGLLWLGERVAAPIQALQRHVRALGEGEFDRTLDLHASGELEDLSRDLNAMGHALRDRMQLQQSLAFARQVQQALLPDPSLVRPGLRLLGHSEFCDSTGGDYFDFFELPGRDAVLIAVGDVMGHGVASALLMATARAALRSEARRSESPGAMLLRVGNTLLESRGHGHFMTMFLLVVEPSRRRVRWANAGHEPGLLITPEGAVPLVLGGGDLPLGIDAGVVYLESVMEDVPAGSLLYLGTDGVTETARGDAARSGEGPGEIFGSIRVNAFLRDRAGEALEEIRDGLLARLAEHRGGSTLRDDLTFVLGRIGQQPE
ncbi:MAG TPA: SpoIIE family protein phosphatase [Phycisphaerales bacterium]|nr:SpoIIE family protein phosphatase [Phycisphaerales bacterium]HMP36795.1 SpoIIE family protein phosphatase [Phycisphaerales bacterium]